MQDLRIKWYRNSADRFIQLLKSHSWNEAVRILKKEQAEAKTRGSI